MLVASPGTNGDEEGRWVRKKMAIAGMQVGMEDFGIAVACLRGFWRVQRWVEREGRRVRGEDDSGEDY